MTGEPLDETVPPGGFEYLAVSRRRRRATFNRLCHEVTCMPVPGYDPEDIDDALESNLREGELEEFLSDDELRSYRHGEADLVDLLDESTIERMLDREPSAGGG